MRRSKSSRLHRRKERARLENPAAHISVPPPGAIPLSSDLPLRAFVALFKAAVERLQIRDPDLAELIVWEYLNLEHSWLAAKEARWSEPDLWEWMEAAFGEIAGRTRKASLPGGLKTTGPPLGRPSNRWLLYARGVSSAERSVKAANVDGRHLSYRKDRSALELWMDLDDPPPTTEGVMGGMRPVDVARIFGRSPDWLKGLERDGVIPKAIATIYRPTSMRSSASCASAPSPTGTARHDRRRIPRSA